jgi:hypothetical protein
MPGQQVTDFTKMQQQNYSQQMQANRMMPQVNGQ